MARAHDAAPARTAPSMGRWRVTLTWKRPSEWDPEASPRVKHFLDDPDRMCAIVANRTTASVESVNVRAATVRVVATATAVGSLETAADLKASSQAAIDDITAAARVLASMVGGTALVSRLPELRADVEFLRAG